MIAPKIPIKATSLELNFDSSNLANIIPRMNKRRRKERKAAYSERSGRCETAIARSAPPSTTEADDQ